MLSIKCLNHENSTAEQRKNLNESSVNTLCMLHVLDPPSVGAQFSTKLYSLNGS